MSSQLSYRPDIDGLRAVAVLSVFVFHLQNRFLPGGFVGVDIFFVISGFLISSIIYSDLAKDEFSFQEFYIRRLRRIQPVLLVVVAVTFFAGMLILLPSDLQFLANSIRSILSFTSNFFFARESDYFNPVSEEYPLLHTWSLAVEEQYYMVLPLFLFVLSKLKCKFRWLIIIILFLALSSFLGAEIFLRLGLYPKYVYYMLPSRMGELFCGGLLGLVQIENEKVRNFRSDLLSLFGLVSLLFSFVFLNSHTIFPGLISLLPCLGSLALIGSGKKSLANRWLAWAPLVYIGSISYSLYLWHYPVLAFTKYLQIESVLGVGLAVAMVFSLSIWSKNSIEDRYRKRPYYFGKAVWKLWLQPALLLLLVVVAVYDSQGFPQRYLFSSGAVAQDVAPFYKIYCHQKVVGDCIIGSDFRPPRILLYGDSHAGHFMPFWDRVGKTRGFSLMARSATSCHPVFSFPADGEPCRELRLWFLAHYKDYKTIVFGERWEIIFGDDFIATTQSKLLQNTLAEMLRALEKNGIRVVVMVQAPKFHDREYEFAMRKKYRLLGLESDLKDPEVHLKFDSSIDQVNLRLREYLKEFPEVVIFDPVRSSPEFVSHLPYRKFGMAYKDGNHLNEAGALELADYFLAENIQVPF